MFSTSMKDRVSGEIQCIKLLHNKIGGVVDKTPTSCRSVVSQVNLHVAIAIEQYSASTLDIEIVGFFLAIQETQLDPINMQ